VLVESGKGLEVSVLRQFAPRMIAEKALAVERCDYDEAMSNINAAYKRASGTRLHTRDTRTNLTSESTRK
jgi:hypothetical protein